MITPYAAIVLMAIAFGVGWWVGMQIAWIKVDGVVDQITEDCVRRIKEARGDTELLEIEGDE